MNMTPIIRMEIEGMRRSIVHAFMVQQKEIEEAVTEETKRVLEGFDFAGAIRREVAQVLPEIIRATIQESLREAMREGKIKSQIDFMVRKAIKDAVEDLKI